MDSDRVASVGVYRARPPSVRSALTRPRQPRRGQIAGVVRRHHGFRILAQGQGNARQVAGLLRPAHLSEREALPRRDPGQPQGRQRLGAEPADRGIEAAGARGRPVEPVPAAFEARARRTVEPRIRDAVRDHGPRALVARGIQLRGARHRQHGDAGALRVRGTEGQVAGAAAARRDPLRLPDDRTGRGVLRRDQYPLQHRARWRPLRDQRHQVVVVGRRRPALQGLYRDGQDQSRCGPPRAAVDDRGAGRHAGHHRQAPSAGVRL